MSDELEPEPIEPEPTPPNDPDPQDPPSDEVVPRDKYVKASRDMMKYKTNMLSLEKEVQALRDAAKKAEENKMVQKEEYKTLYENTKKAKEELEEEKKQILNSVVDEKKFNAVLSEAKKRGLIDHAVDDLYTLDREGIVVEKDSYNRLHVEGVEDYVSDLAKKKPHWFKNRRDPNVNGTLPDGTIQSDKPLTASQLLELEKKDPERYKKEMAKRVKFS